jgi:hypothetical protein
MTGDPKDEDPNDPFYIPVFCRMTQEERKRAWDEHDRKKQEKKTNDNGR